MLVRALRKHDPKKTSPRWAAPNKSVLRAMVKPAVVAGTALTLVMALAALINRLYVRVTDRAGVDGDVNAENLQGGVTYADSQSIYKSIKFE